MNAVYDLFGSIWVVIPGVGLSSFVVVYMNAERILRILREQSLGNQEYILKKLKLMFVDINPRRLTIAMIMLSFGLGVLSFVAFWPSVLPGLLLGFLLTFIGWKLPRRFIDSLYIRRCDTFITQMVDGLTLMANAIRSGLSVPVAMKLVADHMPDPMAQEFELMLEQNRTGASLEEVFTLLAQRIPYPDVQMFVTSVNILIPAGSDISQSFDAIATTIRERIKVEKKIAAITAQGVMQGTIITATPFVLLGIFYFIDPAYIMPLFTKTLGWIILILMLTLQIIGGLMIRKIVKIRV